MGPIKSSKKLKEGRLYRSPVEESKSVLVQLAKELLKGLHFNEWRDDDGDVDCREGI